MTPDELRRLADEKETEAAWREAYKSLRSSSGVIWQAGSAAGFPDEYREIDKLLSKTKLIIAKKLGSEVRKAAVIAAGYNQELAEEFEESMVTDEYVAYLLATHIFDHLGCFESYEGQWEDFLNQISSSSDLGEMAVQYWKQGNHDT